MTRGGARTEPERPGPARRGEWRIALLAVLVLASVGASVAWGQEPGVAADWSQGLGVDEDERRELGEPLGEPLSGVQLEARALEIGSMLRCPQCQGLSVADSPVDAAQSMQAKVRRLVASGYSEEQILAYFETSYGEFIRLSPKPEGFNLVVWILPVLGLLLGVGLIAWRLRGATASAPAAASGDEDLEEYRRKVREAMKQ